MTTKYITRKEYAQKLRDAQENMEFTSEHEEAVRKIIKTTQRVIERNGKDLMSLKVIFQKYIDSSFSSGNKNYFVLDKEEMGEIYDALQETNIHDPKQALNKCRAYMSQGRIITNNIVREADMEYRDLFAKVETPQDYFRFMVEVEEAKNKHIDTFHEEAGSLYNKADDYMKFVYGLICIENYGKKRKAYQPKLKKCKGMIVDWEKDQIKYELFFDTRFKVIGVEGVVKTRTINHQ
ncbi:hypothetical protein OA45_00065 [Bacillus sp. UMTAT18]|uniref:hypothetical protein n=1 Tax=Bacillus TaxID=1386 RepID=UPI000618712E|nr:MULTISPECIES: hypothetical protein [unclassified Bacillus (in: firmicutes)]KKC56429.1 hypothetical protein OA45_00065 [Bacillus sp. UMTAT18]OJD77549.1 hypothetical protein BAU29_18690 [Bacillus sp. P14-1]